MMRHLVAAHVSQAAGSLRIVRTLAGLGQPPVGAGTQAGPVGRAVGLTFDDGPHPQGTPAILALLDAHGARATFFLVGEQVERRPQLAREIVERGHAVAVHGYRHHLQARLPGAAVRRDVDRALNVIEAAVGTRPVLHRPPYGVYSPPGLDHARARGLVPVLWSRWGKDWRRLTTPERIARHVTANLCGGDIVLLHDADFYSARRSHERTTAALELILRELKRRELDTVPLV